MLINRLTAPAAVTGVAVTIGLMIDVNPQAALALVLVAGAAAALGAPAARWLSAAVVATLTFRVFADVGVLPSTATFVDMFLVWELWLQPSSGVAGCRAKQCGRFDFSSA